MPEQYTYDDLMLALAREAYNGEDVIDISTGTTSAALGTSAFFDELAYGASGATTTAYHNTYLYLRRFSGLATAGGASTITLRTSMGDLGAANVLANFTIKITAGTSSGDTRTIASNTDASPTVVTVDSAWTATPDTTSFYEIYPSSATEDRFLRTSRALSTGSFVTTTGEVTVAPAFAGNAGAALSIGIGGDFLFCKDHPNLLRNSINRILRNMRRPILIPLTLIPNGDMEDSSGATTDWTASSAVLVNETSIVRHGRQSLKITATGDSGGALSTIIPLPPNTQVLVAADCYITSADAAGIALLGGAVNTDAGVIDTIEEATSDVAGWVHFEFVATTGASHEWVRLKILGVTSGDVVYFDYTTLLPLSRALFTPPSEATRFGDLGALFYYPRGAPIAGSGNDNAYAIDQKPASPQLAYAVQRDDTAVVPLRIELADTISHPLFLEVTSRYAELTADTDTTYAERDMVVQGAMYHIEMARAAALYAGNPQLASWHRSRAREYAKTYSSMLEGTGISLVEPMRLPQARTAVRLA